MSDAELNAVMRRRCVHLQATQRQQPAPCNCGDRGNKQPAYTCGRHGGFCTILSRSHDASVRYCGECPDYQRLATVAPVINQQIAVADVTPVDVSQIQLSVDVVVTCHNYGRFLSECLDSALAQRDVRYSIVVVDDASGDNTPQIADRYASRGVKYIRIEARNSSIARKVGVESGSAPLVMFLDADNKLETGYLASAAAIMSADSSVGIVACDLQMFGNESRLWKIANTYTPDGFRRQNTIDAGSVVRRQALEQAGALSKPTAAVADDWSIFRKVLDSAAWKVTANPIPLLYRKHGQNQMSLRMSRISHSARPHFDDAGLDNQVVTIFTTYSGRVRKNVDLWRRRLEWLQRQTWPRHQTRLLIANTSHQRITSADIGLEALKLAGMGWYDHPVGTPGLEDINRRSKPIEDAVQTACASIYNRMLKEVSTDYVLILEDDVFPHDADVIERLLSSVDNRTYAVAGCYRQRYQDSWSTYDRDTILAPAHLHRKRGEGVQIVGGAGMGCLLLSTQQVSGSVFVANEPPSKYFDVAWYADMLKRKPHLVCKVDWSLECDHVGDRPPL